MGNGKLWRKLAFHTCTRFIPSTKFLISFMIATWIINVETGQHNNSLSATFLAASNLFNFTVNEVWMTWGACSSSSWGDFKFRPVLAVLKTEIFCSPCPCRRQDTTEHEVLPGSNTKHNNKPQLGRQQRELGQRRRPSSRGRRKCWASTSANCSDPPPGVKH